MGRPIALSPLGTFYPTETGCEVRGAFLQEPRCLGKAAGQIGAHFNLLYICCQHSNPDVWYFLIQTGPVADRAVHASAVFPEVRVSDHFALTYNLPPAKDAKKEFLRTPVAKVPYAAVGQQFDLPAGTVSTLVARVKNRHSTLDEIEQASAW